MKTFAKFFDNLFRQVTKDPKAVFERFKQWIKDIIQAVKKELGLVDEVLNISKESLKILSKMADDALNFPSKQRPKACGVLEGMSKSIYNYSFKGKLPAGVFPKDLHPLVDKWVKEMWELHLKGKIRLPEHHGKCAEVMNISEYLKKIDSKGKMTIQEARKELEGFVSHARQIGDNPKINLKHGEYKKACGSCNPLLEYFGINEYKIIK